MRLGSSKQLIKCLYLYFLASELPNERNSPFLLEIGSGSTRELSEVAPPIHVVMYPSLVVGLSSG